MNPNDIPMGLLTAPRLPSLLQPNLPTPTAGPVRALHPSNIGWLEQARRAAGAVVPGMAAGAPAPGAAPGGIQQNPAALPPGMALPNGVAPIPGTLQAMHGGPPPAPPQIDTEGNGFSRAIGQLFGGAPDPNASIAENNAVRRQALTTAGINMMAASQVPGATFTGSLAQGLAAGQGAGMSYRQQLQQRAGMARAIRSLPPAQAAILAGLPPEAQAEVLTKMMTNFPESKVVGPQEMLFGGDGRMLAQNTNQRPEAALPGDLRGIAALMGVDLTNMTPEQQTKLMDEWERFKRASGMSVTVDARPPIQKAQDSALMQTFADVTQANEVARGQLQNLAAAEALLDAGMTTGRLDELTLPLRQIAAGFGVPGDPEKMGMQEAFLGIANRMALAAKTGMTGPMSDKDIVFLQRMVPAMRNSVLGNRILIEIARRQATFNQARALEMDRWLSEPGRENTRGLLSHMADWDSANALDFSDLRRRAYGPFADLVPDELKEDARQGGGR